MAKKADYLWDGQSHYLSFLEVLEKIYPIGSCYITASNTNPATFLNIGTWKSAAVLSENKTVYIWERTG